MNYKNIDNTMKKLSESGKYNDEQLSAIKYAYCHPKFDEQLILDPSISGDMMYMYIQLALNDNIDIKYYIKNKYHEKGFNDKQLKEIIRYEEKGYDVRDITTSMSMDDIKNNFLNKYKENEKNKLFEKYNVDNELKIKLMPLEYRVARFLLRNREAGQNIIPFLENDLTLFSFDQVRYLFTLYVIGLKYKEVMDPKLSIEQMKDIALHSKESKSFENEIRENHSKVI